MLVNTGVLSVIGSADITVSTRNGAVTLGDTATNAPTANTIVKRDSDGSFSAGSITLNGTLVLYSDTSGSLNTAIGYHALYANTIGYANAANGMWALQSNTNGIYNTAIRDPLAVAGHDQPRELGEHLDAALLRHQRAELCLYRIPAGGQLLLSP